MGVCKEIKVRVMKFDSKNVMSFAINAIDSLTRTAMKEKYGDDCKIMFWENTYIKHQIVNLKSNTYEKNTVQIYHLSSK